jgi:hypothetical protein
MRQTVALLLTCVLAAASPLGAAAQQTVALDLEAAAMKDMARAIPVGSRIKVQLTAGRRLSATLLTVSDAGIMVKRHSRVPEPALQIRFDELARLERDDHGGGISVAKAIGIGLSAGAGAILSLFAIAMSLGD